MTKRRLTVSGRASARAIRHGLSGLSARVPRALLNGQRRAVSCASSLRGHSCALADRGHLRDEEAVLVLHAHEPRTPLQVGGVLQLSNSQARPRSRLRIGNAAAHRDARALSRVACKRARRRVTQPRSCPHQLASCTATCELARKSTSPTGTSAAGTSQSSSRLSRAPTGGVKTATSRGPCVIWAAPAFSGSVIMFPCRARRSASAPDRCRFADRTTRAARVQRQPGRPEP